MNKIGLFFKKCSGIIGIIIFALLLSKANLGEILKNIEKINPLYLILALIMSVPIIGTKAFGWNYIKKQQNIEYSFKNSFLMYASGLFIGLITPGRLGELTKAIYLKKDGCSTGKSLVSVIMDRLSDFVFLIIFIFLGSLFYLTTLNKTALIMILGIFIGICLLLLCWKTGLIKWGFKKLFNIFIPQNYQKSWQINFQEFINDFKIYNFKNYIVIFIITIFSYLFYYIQIYLLAIGLNINIPFFYFALIVTITGLITLIPISISGIGTRDAALILLLAPFAIIKEQAMALSVLILSITVFTSLIGLVYWLIKPIKL